MKKYLNKKISSNDLNNNIPKITSPFSTLKDWKQIKNARDQHNQSTPKLNDYYKTTEKFSGFNENNAKFAINLVKINKAGIEKEKDKEKNKNINVINSYCHNQKNKKNEINNSEVKNKNMVNGNVNSREELILPTIN